MKTNSKHKLLFTTILLTALLVCSAYAALIPNAQAAEVATEAKGMSILDSVVGLNLTKYSVTTSEIQADQQATYFGVLPQEDVEYDLMSGESHLKALCTFVDGKLHIINVLEASGQPNLNNAAISADAVELAEDFLGNYEVYNRNAVYGALKGTLAGVDAGKNATKIVGNTQLEVSAYDDYTTFKWTYTCNGAIAPSKVVTLSFKGGFLNYFVDKWNLYNVGSTSVSLSKEEAVAIALETAKAHNWSLKLNEDTLEARNFNESNVRWTALIFDDSLGADKARNEDPLTVYPVWRVGVALDKWYGNMYGIVIDVWADNKEVRCVQEAWSAMTPEDTAKADGQASAVSVTNSNLAILVVLPTLTVAALGTAFFWASKKKNLKARSLLKRRGLKTGGILFCVLLLSMFLLGAVTTVNATTRAGIVWGSESNAAINPETGQNWRKHPTEIGLQQDIAEYIEGRFDNNGYTGVNHQGNLGSLKTQIFSDLSDYQSNYNYVAVVDFDHGVTEKPGYPAPPNEEHYLFEDNNGTLWGPSSNNKTKHLEHAVFDMDIYQAVQNDKIVFAFISTCRSADLDGQAYLPPPYLYRARGMAFALTHRLVMDKSDPGFDVEVDISEDGYGDPDCGLQVYIGFPWGSASLMQEIPYDEGPHTYYEWVSKFFEYALNTDISVNEALNQASDYIWSQSFGESPLQTGFDAYWWGLPLGEDSTLAVYGNGNIHLKNYEPDYVNKPSVDGPDAGDIDEPLEFNAVTTDPYGHSIQYTFDWGDGSQNVTGWNDSNQTVYMSHSWSSGDIYNVKVKAQCDQGTWSSWSSTHIIYIGEFHELTVLATNQYSETGYVPLYIDDEYVGLTGDTYLVSDGSHTIEVPDIISDYMTYYHDFQYYYYDGNYNYNNEMTLSITEDKTITAYHYSSYA